MVVLWIKEDLKEEEEEGCLVQFLVVEAAAQRLHTVISNYTMTAQMRFILLLKNKQGRGMSSVRKHANV